MRARNVSGMLVMAMLVVAAPAAPAQASATGCTPVTDPMPDHRAHDHTIPGQHTFSCGMHHLDQQTMAELVPEPMMFGEIDVAGGSGIIATAFAEAGFVTLDLADPAHPRPLARYQGPRCEEIVYDVDCGADVKLSSDGTLAFLAIQTFYRAPGRIQDLEEVQHVEPGIHVVDLSDPASPRLAGFVPVEPYGVHMLSTHVFGDEEFVFAANNDLRVDAFRIVRFGPVATLVPAFVIDSEVHDMTLFDDPVTGRTTLLVAGGRTGFSAYDVTPDGAALLTTWTPGDGYYTHSASGLRWGDRRFAFVAPEGFDGARGDEPGPVWLLDITVPSEPRVAGTWTNPSRRASGNLAFSPHNFTMQDGTMFLAHYHGGVWQLDWTPVLDGLANTPDVAGYHVPHGTKRSYVSANPLSRFITAFDLLRSPSVWDVVVSGDHVYASDINSGLYTLSAA